MKIETKRLILRKHRLTDIDDLQEGMNNLGISKFLAIAPYPYTHRDAERYIKGHIKRLKRKDSNKYSFLIELKSNKKVIGGIGLRNIDLSNKTANIGYWINKKYWRRGYGSEAVKAIISLAFNKLKLRRIEAGVIVGNKGSIKLLKKLRFKKFTNEL